MNDLLRLTMVTASLAALPSCIATVGHSGNVTVPKDSAQTCAASCNDLGLTLSSVVIMANTVGCVCAPKGAPVSDNGAGASGGMAAILLEQQAAQQQSNAR